MLKGEIDLGDFRDNPGVIEAEILEEGGRILMRPAIAAALLGRQRRGLVRERLRLQLTPVGTW